MERQEVVVSARAAFGAAWSEAASAEAAPKRARGIIGIILPVQRNPFFALPVLPSGRRCVCHVLIIEDEFLVALDLQTLLEAHGATTFAFAATQAEAVKAARERKPDFITSDVVLLEGSGPKAVEAILQEIGPVPVVFITGTPEVCHPCPPQARVLGKPLHYLAITSAFQEMAPLRR